MTGPIASSNARSSAFASNFARDSNSSFVVNLVTQMEAGGAQTVALRITEGLRERGYNAELWFLYQKTPAFIGHSGVRVLLDRKPQGLLDYVRVVMRLVNALRESRPRAMLTYTHYANVLGQLASWALGIPKRIASQQNPAWSYPRPARLADRAIGVLGAYTTNVMVSAAVADSFASYGRRYCRRAVIVHNATSFAASSLSRDQARSHFGFGEEFVVGAVGRLHPQKNHALLIRSLPFAPGVKLALVGRGDLESSLRDLADQLGVTDRVTWLGETDSQGVSHFLKAIDVYAMPSLFEGLSLALLEALSAGVPIVASDIPPQVEVLTLPDGEVAGILLPKDNHEAWAASFLQLSANSNYRASLSKLARTRAEAFDIHSALDRIEQHLI